MNSGGGQGSGNLGIMGPGSLREAGEERAGHTLTQDTQGGRQTNLSQLFLLWEKKNN